MSNATRSPWRRWHIDAAGVCVCVALTLLFHVGGVLPLLRARANNVSQRTELDSRNARAAKLAAAADILARRLKKVGQTLDEAPVQLQTTRQLNQRLAHLTSLAAECGLAIDRTQSDRPYASAWYQTVPIRLAGEGTYPTCSVFLDRLHRSFGDTGVSGFELVGKPDHRSAAAEFRFDLVWYTQRTLSSAQD